MVVLTMATDAPSAEHPLPALPSPPLVPNKDVLPSPQTQSEQTQDSLLSFPPRSTSIAKPAQATNFSRPVGRKPVPEPQSAKPSRYHGGRKSSGVHPVVAYEQRHSQTSSAPSSDGENSAPSRDVSAPD